MSKKPRSSRSSEVHVFNISISRSQQVSESMAAIRCADIVRPQICRREALRSNLSPKLRVAVHQHYASQSHWQTRWSLLTSQQHLVVHLYPEPLPKFLACRALLQPPRLNLSQAALSSSAMRKTARRRRVARLLLKPKRETSRRRQIT